MKITDAMLFAQAEKAAEIWERSLPESRREHNFSVQFVRKWKWIVFQHKNPWLVYAGKLAAMFVLCFGIGMAAIQVQSWLYVRHWTSMESTVAPEDFLFSEPSYIPAGYTAETRTNFGSRLYIDYRSEDGGLLEYIEEYCGIELYGGNADVIVLEDAETQLLPLHDSADKAKRKTVSINGKQAVLECYDGGYSTLLWTGEQERYKISGILPEEELIRMAESVQPQSCENYEEWSEM